MMPIQFIDLAAQQARIGSKIEAAIARVMAHGGYVLGPEVTALEQQLSAFSGAAHTVTCASGTDALVLALTAKGVAPNDAVFVPAFTFAATAGAVVRAGAAVVFVDVLPDSFTIDPASLADGIAVATRLGLRPTAVIPVDLFGQPCDYDRLMQICAAHGLWMLIDAAHSFGAQHGDRKTGQLGLVTATSFYPTKPLGCYGDGGALFTEDPALAALLQSLRAHGRSSDRNDHVHVGFNSCLDSIQAAVLIEKLAVFRDEIARRQTIAARYTRGLGDCAQTPIVAAGATSVWAQYTLRLQRSHRDSFMAAMEEAGIPVRIYYPKPLHHQTAYRHHPLAAPSGLPVSEELAACVVSLPMHPYLTETDQDYIIDVARRALAGQARAPSSLTRRSGAG
jgi:dTDP-4-amino-4,6-dideoxygalactose transaminase